MPTYTYRNGKWYDKANSQEVTLPDKGHTWKSSASFQIIPDISGYDCPVTGKWISSRKDHRENLKRHNCRLLEKGEKVQNIKDKERALNNSIDRTVHQAVMHIANNIEV